jgi:hypothetical protein
MKTRWRPLEAGPAASVGTAAVASVAAEAATRNSRRERVFMTATIVTDQTATALAERFRPSAINCRNRTLVYTRAVERVRREKHTMEIIHRFAIKTPSDNHIQEFSDLGIELTGRQEYPRVPPIHVFEIPENDNRWPQAELLAADYKITEFVHTRFSRSELDEARAFCILATSHTGYPQPTENFGFLEATYDLSTYCRKCGTGCRQIRPFRIKSVPDLRRRIMQLNWVFDEFFVAHDVWAAVFQPLGIDRWPVLLDKTGDEVGSVVQLRIAHQVNVSREESIASCCPTCGRSKSQLSLRGFAPEPASVPAPIFRSVQYYGSGRQAFNRVFITSSLFALIKKNNLRGVEFYPSVLSSSLADEL